MNIIVFDTETTNLEKPFCYNIGWVIYDTDTDTTLVKRDYVVEQVWHNPMLFTTAYYADKRDLYVSRMKGKTAYLEKFGYITQKMYHDIREYEIAHAFAYNSPFDVGVFAFNCDWFKCINPLDTVAVHDIRGQVFNKIAFTTEYKEYCEAHELFTESGNYSTTAEAVYRYIMSDEHFEEEHTALADSIIELEILKECVSRGAEWATDYKTYRSVPRNVGKEYVVIDAEGTTHTFPYTTKRKISGQDGVRLYVKE